MKRTLCIICAAALLIAAIFAVTASATADNYIIPFLDEGFDSVSEDFLNTGGILPEAERTDNSADINFIADTGRSDTVSGIELSGKHARIESSSTLNGNKYLSFSVPYTVSKNNNPYLRLRLDPMANKNTPKDELALLGDYEFICFDFDFMTETGVYMLNTSIAPVVRILTSAGTHSTVSTSTSASIKLDSEGYYVIGTGSEKVYIDSKPYSWNHLSAVIHVPGGDLPKTTIRYYLNGEPITDENLFFTTFPEASAFYGSDTDYIWIDCLGINLGTKTYLTEDMNLSVDNCRITKYLSGYSGEIIPVFSEDYDMPLGQTVATVRGEHFDDILKAYGAAAPGDTMVLYADASGLTVNKSLTVETRGYSFEYELGRGMSEPTVSDGVYTFDRADEPYTVTWHIGDETFSKECLEGYIPEVDQKVAYSDGGSYVILGFSDKADGDPLAELPAVTDDAEYFALFDKTKPVLYSVIDSLGSESFVFSDEDVCASLAARSDGETFKLYSDINVSLAVSFSKNSSVSLDLNGFSYKLFNPEKKISCFGVGANATLNIYSSRPGGKIFNTAYADGTKPSGHAIFSLSAMGSKVNLGEYRNDSLGIYADGDNLATYSSLLYDIYTKDATNSAVNINGGSYYKTAHNMGSLLMNRGLVPVTIKNATLAAMNGNIFGASSSAAYNCDSTTVCDGCILYSKGGSLMGDVPEITEIIIRNSYLIGNIVSQSTGKIPDIGTGNRFCGGYSIPDSVLTAKTREEFGFDLKYNVFAFTSDYSGLLDSSFDTVTERMEYYVDSISALPGEYCTITWKLLDKTMTERWIKGVVPSFPYAIPEDGEYYKFQLGKITPAAEDCTYEAKQTLNFSVKMNLSLYSDFRYNVYIPTSAADGIISLTLAGQKISLSDMPISLISSVPYYTLTYDIAAPRGAESFTAEISVPGYGGEVFTRVMSFSIPSYAKIILDGGYSDRSKSLMNTTLDYISAAARYFGIDAEGLPTLDTERITHIEGTAPGAVPEGIKSAVLGVSPYFGDSFKFRFNIKESAARETVSFSYYVDKKNVSVSTGVSDWTYDGANKCYYYELSLKAKDIRSAITVTAGGASYAYSLENYIYYINGVFGEQTESDYQLLMDTLYAYSLASSLYKNDTLEVDISIADTPIGEFRIVSSGRDVSSAEIIRAAIYAKTGVMLPISESRGEHNIFVTSGVPDLPHDFSARVYLGDLYAECMYPSFAETASKRFASDHIDTLKNDYSFEEGFETFYITSFVYYSDFGAVGDGVTDDFAAIEAAHAAANLRGQTVYADGGIYNLGAHDRTITVKTNVEWGDAHFIIDDSGFTLSADKKTVVEAAFSTPVFTVSSSLSTKSYAIGELAKGATNIGYEPGFPALVRLYDSTQFRYNREGENGTGRGGAQSEVILVDAHGNVDPTTPILWPYSSAATASFYHADEEPITVRGGIFTTKACNLAASAALYCGRTIRSVRSNVTYDGLRHYVVGEGATGTAYSAFINLSLCTNVLIENCTFTGHKPYKNPTNNTLLGSYDIGAANVNNVTWKNCKQSNFAKMKDASGNTVYVDSVYDEAGNIVATPTTGGEFWGIMGTNFCKNLTYDGCTLSRFDAHCGVYNATIINSEIGHTLSVVGSGTVRIENVIKYNGTLLTLRSDYGSTWEGDMIFKNVTLRTGASDVYLISAEWKNFDFQFMYDGAEYPGFLGTNITVDGLRVESLTGVAKPTATVYIYSASINSLTENISLATLSNGTANAHRMAPPKTVTVTNGNGLSYYLPDNELFSGTKVSGFKKTK